MKLFIALLCATSLWAESQDAMLWRASVASVAAASAADVLSTRGKIELNPLLRSSDGGLGVKGVVIKAAITGSLLWMEARALRKHPEMRRTFTITNFAIASVVSGVAIRNRGID